MRSAPFVAAAAVVAALAACAGVNRHRASEDLATAPAGEGVPLRTYFTGDTAGFLSPCGCQSGQYGGLARRATYLSRIRRAGEVTIDLGNLVVGEGALQKAILAYSLEGLETLGYDALVPGEGEIRMGAAFEEAVRGRAAPTVVCANLLRAGDGSCVFQPWLLRTLRDGRTLAVVGVVEPFDGLPSAYVVTPARDAVRDAVARLAGKADVVVVAGALREDATHALAAEFPHVALVVGGWATVGSSGVVATSGAPAMLVGEYAEYVARVDFDETLRVREGRQAWLDERLPDDPDAAALVARYRAEISQEGGEFTRRLVASLREQSYVGSATCAECHADESATWEKSGHSHAMHTLVEKKESRNPQCVVCHLVDVPTLPIDAANPPSPDHFGIGCEACHGGGARHVEFARGGAMSEAARALAPATRAACLRCHSPPNALHFDFDADWPKIAHGRGAGK